MTLLTVLFNLSVNCIQFFRLDGQLLRAVAVAARGAHALVGDCPDLLSEDVGADSLSGGVTSEGVENLSSLIREKHLLGRRAALFTFFANSATFTDLGVKRFVGSSL